ncbi:hypothetical protein GCM10007338_10070 [Corynebacterium pelargi]|uniref:Uncharacterized protein n=1 Tax=Corynebacterium pelargi TaxID=1471400 RepID=A0A410WB02_9CORY|nr:hypothetical protein CPELA_09385 [Corynebacterium pelargi]GGG74674.1 hypothetical protein GCM10007338_10070 [Corynebacterium pelargi]
MGPALYDGDISTNTSDTQNLRADAQRILIQLTGHWDADFRSGQFEAIE